MKPRARRALARDLEHVVPGGVHFDGAHRAAYATDASIYRVTPLGIVTPGSPEEAAAVVAVCVSHGAPILPRGGGTSLAGQTTGAAVVVDLSKRMHRVLEVDRDGRTARVEPGVVLDRLNKVVAGHGLMFGPDVATSSRACLGGMIGNNSCGARSIVYGKTVDHVVSVDLVLSDGAKITLGPGSRDRRVVEALGIAGDHAAEVRARYPRILRRVSGYNLDELLAEGPNPARLIAGSEGTLGLMTGAVVGLVPKPAATVIGLVRFDDLRRAMDAVPRVLETSPSAVELLDRLLVDLARGSTALGERARVMPPGDEAILIVEYSGDQPAALLDRLADLERAVGGTGEAAGVVRVTDPNAQADVWAVRKAGLGILMSIPGSAKPVAFVEDTAVAPERLGEFVRGFDAIVRSEGASAAFYGHASAGCLHIRPILDLKRPDRVEAMVRITEAVAGLVAEHDGAMSGEHGDGRARSHLLEEFFGPALVGAFEKVKRTFDPAGLFNPGVIVAPGPMTDHLRHGEGYQPPPGSEQTTFHFRREGGLLAAAEACNGNGACRKLEGGIMCPSYMATRDELHSTRGRANALRAALAGEIPGFGPTDPSLLEAMDLCVGCKGCLKECPTSVDVARMKAETLSAWHAEHGITLRERILGRWPEWARRAAWAPSLANGLLALPPARALVNRALGLDPARPLPPVAKQTFRSWFHHRPRSDHPPPPDAGGRPAVVLFDDTFTNHHEPENGRAAVAVLEAAGFGVLLPPRPVCCGRTYLSKGLLADAKEQARRALDSLAPAALAGAPIVGLEPSCILTFRDEIPDLLDDPRAELVARATITLPELLDRTDHKLPLTAPRRTRATRVMVHGHCHEKALVGMAPTRRLLARIPGLEVEVADTTCCGMAGSFGYEAEHAAVSRAIAEVSFLPAIRRAGDETILVMDGTSCRQQAAHIAGREAVHIARFLESLLPSPAEGGPA